MPVILSEADSHADRAGGCCLKAVSLVETDTRRVGEEVGVGTGRCRRAHPVEQRGEYGIP